MSHTLDAIIDIALSTPGRDGRRGIPSIFWGAPGEGKTSILMQRVKKHSLPGETVILSFRDPSDVAGLPIPDGKGGFSLAPPSWARRLADAGRGVLFLDELSTAAPAVQAAALRILAEGVVGDLTLPPDVRILAAANPVECAAGGYELSAPTANRVMHVDWPSLEARDWADWLGGDCQDTSGPAREIDPTSEAWLKAWTMTRACYAGLMRSPIGAGVLSALPDNEADRGRAWPSPRSNEMAARALAGCKAMGESDGVAMAVLTGCIGQGAAVKAWEYLSKLDLPDVEDVLAGKATIPMDRGDRTYATLTAIIQTVDRDPADDERRVRALELANTVAAKYADVAAACARPLAAKVAPLLRKHAGRVSAVLRRDGPLGAIAQHLAPVGTVAPAGQAGPKLSTRKR